MTRWRSFLAVLGIAAVGVSGYFLQTEDGRTLPTEGRYRDGRGRFGRGGDPCSSRGGVGCATTACVVCACTPGTENALFSSQNMASADWSTAASGAAGPTRLANAGAAPDGTTTATSVFIPETTAAQYSFVRQSAVACLSESMWFQGVASSGVQDFCVYGSTSPGAWSCVECPYSASWLRCERPNVAVSGATTYFAFGNMSSLSGGTPRLAANILVWGGQCEPGSTVTGYMATGLGAPATCP